MIRGAFYMLEILMFFLLLFFAVAGFLSLIVFILLKISAPTGKKGIVVVTFSDEEDREYILRLKWLICLFWVIGIEGRLSFMIYDEAMSERKRQEILSVFGRKNNIFVSEGRKKQ